MTTIPKLVVTDVAFAAALRHEKYGITEITVDQERKQASFVFVNVDRHLIDTFNRDQLMVEAKMYAGLLRQLVRTAKEAVRVDMEAANG